MRKRGAGYDGNWKKGKECKSKRKHQRKKTLCCMEQPPKQRWKEQKTGKRREKGENLVYLLATCPGNSLPSSIFYLFLWYLPIFICFSFPPPAQTSVLHFTFFLCTQGALFFCLISSLFHFHSGISSSCSSFHFSGFSLASSFHAPCSYLLPHSSGSFMLQQPYWLLCFPEEPITAQIVPSIQ